MQMQTLSARIPTEDMEWLAGLNIQGAVSPSDKLRALISQMRRQQEGALDYERSLAWLRDLAVPSVTRIKVFEHQQRMHSEVLSLASEWVPQMMAALLAERTLGGDAKKKAVDLEDFVAERCFKFLTSMMRLAVTPDNGCYSPAIIDRYVAGVLEIAVILAQLRKAREEKIG
jgi:hypothetical protein